MITDEELNIILDQHGYADATGACWPGCYEFHAHCAIRWLVATVRELAPYAAKRIETKGITEETREKEIVRFMEFFVEMMRITNSHASNAYLEADRILRDIKGLPPDMPANKHRRKKNPTPKKPKTPELEHFDYEQLD
jgi:hypothetical protein